MTPARESKSEALEPAHPQIARYRILEQLGSGGMSVVYRGIDTLLDREVAIKVLHPHLASKAESRLRFCREAQAVARLHHPNILEIFDFSSDESSDKAFIVTELIRGTTLRTFAEKTSFHPPEIAALAVHELAGALEHAHCIGVIHRDLKPENVMIRQDGVLKLMDFGIAKILDHDERMTMTGALVGSPAHMAPEIVEGSEASREADVFSLGTILYWLCCRRLPFLGNNTTQTLKLVLDGKYPDPRIHNAAVSDELAAIMARSLARDPKARYANGGELRDALASALLASGLDRPSEELAAFFSDPEGYGSRLKQDLIARLLEEGGRFALGPKRNQARALERLNRVLALDPESAKAKALVTAMQRRRRHQKQLTTLLTGIAGLGALAGASFGLYHLVAAIQPRSAAPLANSVQKVSSSLSQSALLAPTPAAAPTPPVPAPAPVPAAPALTPPMPGASKEPAAKQKAQTAKILPNRTGAKQIAVARPELGNLTVTRDSPLGSGYQRIFVDGEWKNPGTPDFQGMVPSGKHRIRVESSCCLGEREVEVRPGTQNPPVRVVAAPRPALLKVKSAHEVEVWVGDMLAGSSSSSLKEPIAIPIPDGKLSGPATLRFFRKGLTFQPRTENFHAGQPKTIELEPEKP